MSARLFGKCPECHSKTIEFSTAERNLAYWCDECKQFRIDGCIANGIPSGDTSLTELYAQIDLWVNQNG